MTRFNEWCTQTKTLVTSTGRSPAPTRTFDLLILAPTKEKHAVKVISSGMPSYYADPSRIAGLLSMLGKRSAAKYVKGKLPSLPNIRSGDLGEILCNAFVTETTTFKFGIRRLRWKDHRNMSMRGEDVLAFSLAPKTGALQVLKAEVKSGGTMKTAVINKARAALDKDNSLPSPHALSFVADQLSRAGEYLLSDAIDTAALTKGLRGSQVTHMLFTFSGNDPSKEMLKSLNGYLGKVKQQYVALQVQAHTTFIKSVFDKVTL